LHQPPKCQTLQGLERELLRWGRTTTLRLYSKAFSETDDRDAIEREFLPLVAMAHREGSALQGTPPLDVKPLISGPEPPYASESALQSAADGYMTNNA
jgi:hypothetical protein